VTMKDGKIVGKYLLVIPVLFLFVITYLNSKAIYLTFIKIYSYRYGVGNLVAYRVLRGGRPHRNFTGIYVLPVPEDLEGYVIEAPWDTVLMPNKSYFIGLDAPMDAQRWRIAQIQAGRGEQILLSHVLKHINSPEQLCPGDLKFRWVHRATDVLISTEPSDGGIDKLLTFNETGRVPIALLGYRIFDKPNFEGGSNRYVGFGPDQFFSDKNYKIPRKFIGVGNMDENWGWLSTYFHNRYCTKR